MSNAELFVNHSNALRMFIIEHSHFPSMSAMGLEEKKLARFIYYCCIQNASNKLSYKRQLVMEKSNTGLFEWQLVWQPEKLNNDSPALDPETRICNSPTTKKGDYVPTDADVTNTNTKFEETTSDNIVTADDPQTSTTTTNVWRPPDVDGEEMKDDVLEYENSYNYSSAPIVPTLPTLPSRTQRKLIVSSLPLP